MCWCGGGSGGGNGGSSSNSSSRVVIYILSCCFLCGLGSKFHLSLPPYLSCSPCLLRFLSFHAKGLVKVAKGPGLVVTTMVVMGGCIRPWREDKVWQGCLLRHDSRCGCHCCNGSAGSADSRRRTRYQGRGWCCCWCECGCGCCGEGGSGIV